MLWNDPMPKLPLPALLLLTGLAATANLAAQPALTLYNQNFAVVRDTVPLDLKAGVNEVRFPETTARLEPDSVILRDPSGKITFQILEQNYRNDPVSQELLLSLNEGKTIDFQIDLGSGQKKTVQGKIIRSGYNGLGSNQPIIEVDGKLRFGLPGQPLFPALADDTILKPTLDWQIRADKPGKVDAELAYGTGGMTWEADYNLVAPEKGDLLDLVGWVTMDNRSGKTFENAKIKLMAGDVNKIRPEPTLGLGGGVKAIATFTDGTPAVTEKAFDEYHLYTLERPATLHDHEIKQVEFIHASGVQSQRIYVYDGLKVDFWNQLRGSSVQNIRDNVNFGTESNPKVAVMREFKNSEANHLGMPLPRGRVRFYKQDGQQLEFTGENVIAHTPRDETVRLYTGNAFDLVGERHRTAWNIDHDKKYADESFEIKLRNHKKESVEIRVVEHLYRGRNWEITAQSAPSVKTDAQTMEFRIPLKPDEEKTLTYTVHYSW